MVPCWANGTWLDLRSWALTTQSQKERDLVTYAWT